MVWDLPGQESGDQMARLDCVIVYDLEAADLIQILLTK